MSATASPTHVERASRTHAPPGRVAPPDDIPEEIFDAALATVLDLRRLDMQALASELGIGRATLYRRVAGRDHLLGAVVSYLTRRAMARALEGTERLAGHERVLAVVERFMRAVRCQPALRRMLDAEPQAALRILTSRKGLVQQGFMEAVERLLAEEEALGTLRPAIDRRTLAYVIVRLCESFLYADVIADREPDVGLAVALIGRLLRNGRWQAAPHGAG